MVALLADPMTAPVPSSLLPWQARAVVRSGELAVTRGLRLVGRGVCRVRGHEGAPVFAVSSATRANVAHLVWIERGRIHCTCEARTLRHTLTCSHAQFIRLLIVAERAAAFIEPTPEPAPVAPDSEPDPDPTPSGPRGPRCPSCAGPIDPTELAELGECLNCLHMRADYERSEREAIYAEAAAATQVPCWACGAIATNETAHGLYCDDCISLPEKERRSRARARQQGIARQIKAEKAEKAAKKAQTANRVIAREQARERAGIPSEASPRYKTETGRRAAEKEAARQERLAANPPKSQMLTREEQLSSALASIKDLQGK